MIKKYRKLPVEINAVIWNGRNVAEVDSFLGLDALFHFDENGIKQLRIKTLEGLMDASIGDYIIRGVNGEHYACKPDVFVKTYEEVNQ